MANKRKRPKLNDPAAEEAYRRHLFGVIAKKASERDRIAAASAKPPKPIPESPAADNLFFWPLVILSVIGAAVMTVITAQERPGALLQLWLFFEGPAFVALGVAANQIFVKPQPAMHPTPIRWFTAYGVIVAIASAAIATVMGLTKAIGG